MASVRLSPTLKTLISAPHAQGGPLPAPSPAATARLFEDLATSGEAHGLGARAWLTLGSAACVTLNSPASLCALYTFVASRASGEDAPEKRVEYAAVMREVGLKTISFSGIPRAINNLGALRAHLPEEVASQLSAAPTRQPTPSSLPSTLSRGTALWSSIYQPHHTKLISKLSASHPDLPIHILSSHYSMLLADPFTSAPPGHAKVGRILTSVVAIACLRAQGGVGPQVTSHIFGLLKAAEDGSAQGEEEEVEGAGWLTSEEGARWVVEQTDRIVEAVTKGQGSFATRAKL
ncbi:hypothetical protein JCM10213_006173 [Rhodosporidiobolus nylandii]